MCKLWSDGKTEDDCVGVANDELAYNLLEDIRCLKEENEKMRKDLSSWRKMLWDLQDANSKLIEAVKKSCFIKKI